MLDVDLIRRLAAEASDTLPVPVESILPRPGRGVALLFGGGRPALDLVPGPPRGWLASTGCRLRSGAGPEGRMLSALREIPRLEAVGIEVLAGDRVVRIRLQPEGVLVLELIGGASNLYLLDADLCVLARARAAGRPGGPLTPGDVWRPPGPGTPVWEAPGSPAAGAPGLGAPCPESGSNPLDPLSPGDLVLRADGPGPEPEFIPARRLGDAVILRERWLQRHEETVARLAQVRQRLAAEAGRLRRLQDALEGERRGAAGHATARRSAEAILAGLHQAQREGDTVVVPDPYTPGAELRIKVKPGRDLRAHADRLFLRAGRLERALPRIETKLRELEARRARSVELVAGLEQIREPAELDALEEALGPARSTGRQAPPQPARGKKAARGKESDPRARKIRRYPLAEGWTILVGGSAQVNDYLTFRVAAPRDFWLHAADYPGAHVIIRNPSRLEQPPEPVLRRAAGLAISFSKVPGGKGPADVRWTQARHVRKGRGLPPGTVLLPRFSTLRATGWRPGGSAAAR